MNSFLSCIGFIFLSLTLSAQQQVPDVALKTLKKQSVQLANVLQDADYTVLSFWASWCAPCKRELNTISEVYEDWQKDYNMQLVAITIDDQRMLGKVPGIVSSNWWKYIVLSDAQLALKNALNIATIPRTMIVDKAGNILYDHNGYKPGDELELEAKLKALNQ